MSDCLAIQHHRKALLLTGWLSLIATVLHGAWQLYMPGYSAFEQADDIALDSVFMLNGAITLFLFFSALAAFWVARSTTMLLTDVRAISLCILGFWLSRFALELVLPSPLPFLFIQEPNLIIRVFMLVFVAILATPFLVSIRRSAGAVGHQ